MSLPERTTVALETITVEMQKQSKGEHFKNKAYYNASVVSSLYYSLNNNDVQLIQQQARLAVLESNFDEDDMEQCKEKLFIETMIDLLKTRNENIKQEIKQLKSEFI